MTKILVAPSLLVSLSGEEDYTLIVGEGMVLAKEMVERCWLQVLFYSWQLTIHICDITYPSQMLHLLQDVNIK